MMSIQQGMKLDGKRVILLLLISVGLALPVMGAEKMEMTKADYEYGWTDENPKPFWWRWDEVYYPEKPVRGGYIRYAANRDPGLFNPNHWPVNDWAMMSNLYDWLLYPDGEWRPTVPWLAKSWKFENELTCLMKLRKGVKFTDGSDFNAHTVKYQIDWIMDRKNGAWSRGWLRPLKSVDAVDDVTLRWHFKEPWAAFLMIVGDVPGWPISMKALKADQAIQDVKRLEGKIKLGERKVKKAKVKAAKATGNKAKKLVKKLKKEQQKLDRFKKDMVEAKRLSAGAKPIDAWAQGGGRFMLEEVKSGNYTKAKRNPNWWFGQAIGHPDMPYFDGYIVTVIPENSVKLANLKAAKLDSLGVDHTQYDQVKDDPNLNVWITPGNWSIFGAFNHRSVFKDIRLRKAVSHAIDRKALIAAAQGGFGREASCILPDDHWAYNKELKPIKYDPELSRKLIKEAGYPNGLTITGVYYGDSSARRYGEILRTMLKMVNINYKIDYLEYVAAQDRFRNLEWDFSTWIAVYVKSPDTVMTNFYAPEQPDEMNRFYDEKSKSMIQAARQEQNHEKRKKIYLDLQKYLYDNYFDAWFSYSVGISATRKEVRGYNREFERASKDAYWPSHSHWFKDGKRE